jgi:protein-disulfide isomerase
LLLLVGGTGTASQRVRAAEPGAHPERHALNSVEPTLALFRGIPQTGVTLGEPNAPFELIEFADLQCPFCAAANTRVLPQIVERYVRPGKLKIVFRSLTFVGPDSERAARTAAAVGLQGHLWEFVHLQFENQGRENTGYATDTFLKGVAAAIPGVNVARAMRDRDSAPALDQVREASAEAERLGVHGTPEFFLVAPGKPPRRVEMKTLLSAPAFDAELERLSP